MSYLDALAILANSQHFPSAVQLIDEAWEVVRQHERRVIEQHEQPEAA